MHSPTGEPDPRLARALLAHTAHASAVARAEVLASLIDAQVLAPLSAAATGHELAAATGLPAESGAELSLMLLESSDGARALPVFSDIGSLRRWRLDARPVPLTGAQACAAAQEQGASHVLLDPGGAAVALGPVELAALATGWVPVPGSSLSSRTQTHEELHEATSPPPALVEALVTALAAERLTSARLLQGPDGLVLGVSTRRPLEPAALAALGQRVAGALGATLPADGLQLQQVPVRGPGLSLLRRRRFRW